ncbi:MAG TPA: biopolymer transporter ExbD [Candidatus Acidoferrales bacterium]|nr:biopolymer transporter ExbD [Candidatus Acidoferrales bacterium]
MAYKPKAPAVMASPNVIPMADIMLVLLIIFMVVTPMLQKGVSVDMAKANNAQDMQDADKDDAIIVAVTRDGHMYLGSTQVNLDEITNKVKDLLANRLDKTVFVRSDQRAKYGEVVKAVDEVRSAGVDKIGLLTEKNRGKSGAPAAPTPPPAD